MSKTESFLFHPMKIEQTDTGEWEIVRTKLIETSSYFFRPKVEKIETTYRVHNYEEIVLLDVDSSSAVAVTSIDGKNTSKHVHFMARSKLSVLGAKHGYYKEMQYGRQKGLCSVSIQPAENEQQAGEATFRSNIDGTEAVWRLNIYVLHEQLNEIFSAIERKVFSGASSVWLDLDKESSSLIWSTSSSDNLFLIDTIDAQEFVAGFDDLPDEIKAKHFVCDEERLVLKAQLGHIRWKSSRHAFDSY